MWLGIIHKPQGTKAMKLKATIKKHGEARLSDFLGAYIVVETCSGFTMVRKFIDGKLELTQYATLAEVIAVLDEGFTKPSTNVDWSNYGQDIR